MPCLAADPTAAAALLEPFERVRDGASPVVRIPPERREFLESLFREFSVSPKGAADADLVRRSLLTLIINEVARAARARPHRPRRLARGRLEWGRLERKGGERAPRRAS